MMQAGGICKPMDKYELEDDSTGKPKASECQKTPFWEYYTTPEVQTLFRALYFNNYGLQDKYMKFEEAVARRLSSNPFVVGFDPINEPVGVFKNFLGIIDALIPGKWDRMLLEPFYSRVYQMLEQVNRKNIMFFEATLPDWVTLSIGKW